MSTTRDNFSAQVDTELLMAVRELARSNGRELDALVAEAFTDLIEKYNPAKPRPQVMAAYRECSERFSPLLKKLAE